MELYIKIEYSLITYCVVQYIYNCLSRRIYQSFRNNNNNSMDLSSAEWFGQEIDEWQMMNATFDDFAVFSPETTPFTSSDGYCSSPFPPLSSSNGFQTVVENPAGAVNRVQEASSSSSIISFANSDLPWASQHLANCTPKGASVKTEMVFTSGSCVADGRKDMIGFGGAGAVKKGAAVRNAVQAQDHVMAERRRREKLTQCFIALSSLVPGLKKVKLFKP